MTTLQQQPAVYPPGLLKKSPDTESTFVAPADSASPRSWWAIYTRSRCEKTLARKLYINRVPFYLPLVSHQHVYQGSKVKSSIPLFSNYMFLFGTEDERIAALATNSVSRMLPVLDKETLFRELIQLYRLIDFGATLTVERHLQSGCPVRIKAGVLEGVEGMVVERRGESRLLVAVNYIQQGVSLAIDDLALEPI